jgi:hypothetical protein
MTASDWWKFHRGIVDTPKLKPKSYSLYDRTGATIVHDRPYAYCLQVKKKYKDAEIKPNY